MTPTVDSTIHPSINSHPTMLSKADTIAVSDVSSHSSLDDVNIHGNDLEEHLLHQSPAFNISNLPLVTINHISFAVPYPKLTASFFIKVLGFVPLSRPDFLDTVDGAWICGLGIELHFIEKHSNNVHDPSYKSRSLTRFPSLLSHDEPIDTRNDHLSFLCRDQFDTIVDTLHKHNVNYTLKTFPGDNLRQVFFSDPTSGILIEVSTNPKC